MKTILAAATLLSLALPLVHGYAFTTQNRFSLKPQFKGAPSCRQQSKMLSMRDASASYWFSVGDRVKVLEPVQKAGISLEDRTGVVVETWEKCDVDPTCCCAEQVERDMAVRVEFMGTEADESAPDCSFQFHFAEDELEKLKKEEEKKVAFDGMSCVAFKLDAMEAQRKAVKEAQEARARGI